MTSGAFNKIADGLKEAIEIVRGSDSGWDHPAPPGTYKVKCCRCALWFACRDGIEMCPICRTQPSKTPRRFLQKRK